MTGWPDEVLGSEYQPYLARKYELSVLYGCILRASCVIVPLQSRQLVLDELHEMHPDISKIKVLAWAYMWWPSMDEQIMRMSS